MGGGRMDKCFINGFFCLGGVLVNDSRKGGSSCPAVGVRVLECIVGIASCGVGVLFTGLAVAEGRLAYSWFTTPSEPQEAQEKPSVKLNWFSKLFGSIKK